MTNQHESIPDLMQEDTFEVVMRGYNRRQVHDYMIRTRNQVRDLEERLARAIDQAEQGRIELAEARRRMVEAPQSYDDLSPRLAQILRLGEEEAAAKREDAETEAASVRDAAKSEAERLVTSSRETADKILTSAQAEAERRVSEATAAAERMLAQAGADAEEQLTAARNESEEALRESRTEAERVLSAAQSEAEQLLQSANAQAEQLVRSARDDAESMLADAQQRTASIDEQAGRRVDYLTNTHTEVVRRLTEISSVLGDLMHTESAAGTLIPESITAPPVQPSLPAAQEPQEGPSPQEDVRVIIEDDEPQGEDAPQAKTIVSDDTDVNIIRLSEAHK
jgi:cell division septum initiation protein DivIVA